MIISKTPLRISFVGGGSDLRGFYRRRRGAVVSTAIDKYVYVNVNKKFDEGIRVAYSKTEEVTSIDRIEHPLVRSCLEYLGIEGGIEITTLADIPSVGTGLGSSSSFTVGLLNALSAYLGRYTTRERLSADACFVEIERCGEPIGKQDQYAAAFGGFNLIEFNPDESVTVSPITCEPRIIRAIERNILVFYTGITRRASHLLRHQAAQMEGGMDSCDTLNHMVSLAYTLRAELHANNTDAFGEILHENWMLKKTLTSGITNGAIDDWYAAARGAGAIGGKILGAGGGGFLLLYAPSERHEAIAAALADLRQVDVRFEQSGSAIIFYH